jgi:hypothetical protein
VARDPIDTPRNIGILRLERPEPLFDLDQIGFHFRDIAAKRAEMLEDPVGTAFAHGRDTGSSRVDVQRQSGGGRDPATVEHAANLPLFLAELTQKVEKSHNDEQCNRMILVLHSNRGFVQ